MDTGRHPSLPAAPQLAERLAAELQRGIQRLQRGAVAHAAHRGQVHVRDVHGGQRGLHHRRGEASVELVAVHGARRRPCGARPRPQQGGPTTAVLLLELHDVSEDVEEDVLGALLSEGQVLHDPQHLARLGDEVLQVLLAAGQALVGQLRQPQGLPREVLIQVELVQCRRRGLPHGRREAGGLRARLRTLELRRDERERLVRHPQQLVAAHRERDEVCVEAEQTQVEELGEVPGQRLHALQARLQGRRQRLHIRDGRVVRDVGVGPLGGHVQLQLAQQPEEQQVGQLGVLLLVQPVVPEQLRRPQHHQPAPLPARLEHRLGLPHRTQRPIHGVRHGSGRQQRNGRPLHIQRGPVRVHEGQLGVLRPAGRPQRRAVALLACSAGRGALLASRQRQHVLLAGNVWDQDTLRYEHLFRVEVFVEYASHDAITIYTHPILFKKVVHIASVLLFPTISKHDESSTT
mmetsp:Transcript_6874/g.10222  ORF Transcript_6874/g.10222 Transcript_6874/m.10222 type:complete len:461 (+) Transcript_6874:73-1455(+)